MSNSPRNGPESAERASVNDLHVSAPWGSVTMEISMDPKILSVDDLHVNAPRGSLIVEIAPGPQKGEQ